MGMRLTIGGGYGLLIGLQKGEDFVFPVAVPTHWTRSVKLPAEPFQVFPAETVSVAGRSDR